jgi:hypothetical protein
MDVLTQTYPAAGHSDPPVELPCIYSLLPFSTFPVRSIHLFAFSHFWDKMIFSRRSENVPTACNYYNKQTGTVLALFNSSRALDRATRT